MNSLIGQHGVFRDGREIGSVTAAAEGLMTVFECSCDYRSADILRLAGVSGDKFVSLGVVAPEAGRLRMKKSFSKSALAALRLDEDTSFYLITSGETLDELKRADGASASTAADEPESPEIENVPEKPEPVVRMTLGARPADIEKPPADIEKPPVDAVKPPPYAEKPPGGEDVSPGEDKNSEHSEAPARKNPPKMEAANEPREIAMPPYEIKPAPPAALPQAVSDAPPDLGGKWKPVADPSALFTDGEIADVCKGVKGALSTERGGFTLLAIPAAPDTPFPMMPVFCFGNPEVIEGNEYIVFKIKNGILAF